MHEALARAKQDSDSRLWRSVLLMVGLVSLVTGLGLVLSRAQTVHITSRWGRSRKRRGVGQGRSLGARGHHSGDELAVLGSSFNRMVDELNSSYRRARADEPHLGAKVEARLQSWR